MKKIISLLLICFGLLNIFSACEDNFDFSLREIPEGHSEVTFDLSFMNFTPALETRTAGNTIKAIDMLWLVIYDADGKLYLNRRITADDGLSTSVTENSRPDSKPSSESATGHADFKLVLPNGRYEMYAVANVDLSTSDVSTPEKLKKIRMTWNDEHIEWNNQMFGQFTNQTSDTPSLSDGSLVEIAGNNSRLHAWMRRCASKITVAYDGSNLKDGVAVYLMAVRVHDIPTTCPLGNPNTPTDLDSIIHDGERIFYCTGDEDIVSTDFINNYHAKITNTNPHFGSDHSDAADALFFYENMQGYHPELDKRQKDNDGDGKPDDADILKDRIPYGTYIEVEAVYRSTNPNRPGNGLIKYRFMLGKDIIHDFDAERNHHYKLTLRLNGYANDYDWHIDYGEQILRVTDPVEIDYRGMVFLPNRNIPNLGHVFSPENEVTVESYMENDEGKLLDFTVKFKDEGATSFSDQSSWLQLSEIKKGVLPYQKIAAFTVKPNRTDVRKIDIDKTLQEATAKGNATNPFNLANPTQGAVTPAAATALNTANSYIVDAPGYYLIPCVYGNAIKNGANNKAAYESSFTGSSVLKKFKNHLGNDITDPWITNNAGCTPRRAAPILQDEYELVTFDIWAGNAQTNVRYLPEAYGGKGGIIFYVNKSNIKQGNATIGLMDNDAIYTGADGNLYSNVAVAQKVPILWSWHIWFTSLKGIDEKDHTLAVTTNRNDFTDRKQVYEFLPMNLGWCSDHGDEILYYPERRCTIQFQSGEKTEEIEIVQRSHISFTCGNNTYYQWGRKDPFFGALNNTWEHNKTRYLHQGWSDVSNYGVLNGDMYSDAGRVKTNDPGTLGDLVKYPYLWHNPPRKEPGYNWNKFQSTNETFSNLWGGQTRNDTVTVKTVYDPCPVGFRVPHYVNFSGFTFHGHNTDNNDYLRDCRIVNNGDYDPSEPDGGKYIKNVFELYTSDSKTQSIMFPMTGYRDWDNAGYAFQYSEIGFAWTAVRCFDPDDLNDKHIYSKDNDWIFNFVLSRTIDYYGYIYPGDVFFSCDGFPIRPVKEYY